MLSATPPHLGRCRSIFATRDLSKLMQPRPLLVAPNQFQLVALSNSLHPSCYGLPAVRSINTVASNRRWHQMKIQASQLKLLQRWRSSTSDRSHSKKFTRISFDGCHNVGDVLQLAMKLRDESRPNQTAAAWSFITRLISYKDQHCQLDRFELERQIKTILQHTSDSLGKCKPKELATITLSIAKIVRSIREAHQRRRVNIYHQAFGNVFQESSSIPNQGIFHALAQATDANLLHFNARDLSNTAYAYALLGYDPTIDGRTLLGGIAQKSIDCVHQFEPQGIGNTLWAFGKLKVHHPRLFQSVGDAVASKRDLNDFTPQEIANMVWSFATLKVHHPRLFRSVGDAVASKCDLNKFKPQELANIVWAYAANDKQHPGLFKKVGDSIIAIDNLRSFDSQNLANMVWAYATSNVHHPGLFKKVGDSIVSMDDLRSFVPQALANIVWAYATSNTQHPGLFNKIGDAVASSDGSKPFTTQALANLVWAYAKSGVNHPGLFKKIGKSIGALDDLSSFNPQELANIAWSFAEADVDVPRTFNDAFTAALAEKENEFNVKNLTQLYKWHVWQVEKSNTGLPEILRERCEQAFKNSRSSSSHVDSSSSILH